MLNVVQVRSAVPPLQLRGVDLVRDGRTVLRDIDLALNDDRIAVIGANGSGKSSLARLLNALLLPTRGDVLVGDLRTDRDAREIRRKVGFVFQNPDNQIVMPVVADDLAFGCRNIGVPRNEIADRVQDALAALGLEALHDRESHTLSGGERQLVALAAVLVMHPEVIIFDEPTTMLDLRNRLLLQQHIDQLPQQAILVSHDLELVERYPRVIVLDQGKIVFDGPSNPAIDCYRELCR